MKSFLLSSLIVSNTTLLSPTISLTKENAFNHNYKTNNCDLFDQEFKNKSIIELKIMKENLINAISIKNQQILVDKNKLNQKIWNTSIYQLITSDKYTKSLALQLKMGLISFNKNKQIKFETQNNEVNIWAESHWYWFGYWKLHFSHDGIDTLGESGHGAAAISLVFPPAAPAALSIAGVVLANTALLRAYDYGNGSWLGIYLLVPDMGWGSN